MADSVAQRHFQLANRLLLGVLLLLLLLSASSTAAYLLQPQTYRFGTEVGGLLYRSRAHYLGFLLTEAAVLLGGLLLSLQARSVPQATAIRLSVVLLDLLFLAATRPAS